MFSQKVQVTPCLWDSIVKKRPYHSVVNNLQILPSSKASFKAPIPFIDAEGAPQVECNGLNHMPSINTPLVIVYLDHNDLQPLNTLLKIKELRPNIGVIFIGGVIDLKILVDLFRRGLDDYLLDTINQNDIDDAIKRIEDQKKSVKFDPMQYGLTKREAEVCRLLIKGLMSTDIAANLQITPATVKVHKARVMKKLKVNALPDLVRKASTH